MTQFELDEKAASCVLYLWACDEIGTAKAKAACEYLNFLIDFRQADTGNLIEATYRPTNKIVHLEV